ncbi:zinc-binding dehydrogenase [Streptomyces sp. NPDC051554]|uniref:zinc-binding dehydrogenase n=1 Tax=Streptomyces sp. NPDC051554 TaxID=3365656 RepID=UPI0037A5F652
MRAVVRRESGGVRVTHVPDPTIEEPTDAVVRVVLASVCGTDLWGYRGEAGIPPGPRAGHEFLGVVEDVGRDVEQLHRGDLVLAPFLWADGTCVPCRSELSTSCPQGGMWGGAHDGGQGEGVRVPFADATLVRIGLPADDERLPTVLTLADVMATGSHAARAARVSQSAVTAVVGDGAVGLCGVLAARRAGAERVVLFGRHPARAVIGRAFGATDVITERGEEALARLHDTTGGQGADSVLECVGTQLAVDTALALVRDGGAVALVGAPHGGISDLAPIFLRNLTVSGGLAPARSLIPALLQDVLAGRLDPSPVFDLATDLAGVPAAYEAMAERTALKALIRV